MSAVSGSLPKDFSRFRLIALLVGHTLVFRCFFKQIKQLLDLTSMKTKDLKRPFAGAAAVGSGKEQLKRQLNIEEKLSKRSVRSKASAVKTEGETCL